MARAASLALLLVVACVSSCAEAAQHPLLRVLTASSRDASLAAARSAHARRALLLSRARHATRRRLDETVPVPTDATMPYLTMDGEGGPPEKKKLTFLIHLQRRVRHQRRRVRRGRGRRRCCCC